jgi:uncharacterized protein YfaS (alpha-2-macroglobulin family)
MDEHRGGDVVFAQAQFNLYRPGEWVTVGAGTRDDVARAAAAGLYGRAVSPRGDTPYRVRVRAAASEAEEARAAVDLRLSAGWARCPPAG